jgi:hypothetical protein
MGNDKAVELLQILKPAIVIPLMNAEIDQEGALSGLIQEVGSLELARRALRDADIQAEVRLAQPAQPINLVL